MAIGLLIGGYFAVDNFLTEYTQHNEKIPVPNLQNIHINELAEVLEKNGFRYELIDSVFERKKTKGIIVEQKPKAGQSVKPGRKIYLTINARVEKKIKLFLDNILGGDIRPAMDNFASVDVAIDSIEYVASQYPIVLGVKNAKGKSLENNEEVLAGSKLILVVGKTGDVDVQVPNVVGKNLRLAKQTILENNLNVAISGLPFHICGAKIDSSRAIIKRQSPEAFEEIKIGSSVSLFYDCDTVATK